ncbi:MAG: IS66 family transposase [Salinivirgaceae bacterium]|jgi:transposase|nr:IS66 family transposase [Salinivirgaceae bacterium]
MADREILKKLSKDELIDIIFNLNSTIDQLIKEVNDLKEEVRILKSPKNSGNSSFPPSRDLYQVKNKSLREKSNRLSGGQHGHKGETLQQSKNPDEVINHFPNEECPDCGRVHNADNLTLKAMRQVIDIPPIQANIIEHRIFQRECPCGHMSKGQFPAGVTAPVQYGSNLTTLVAYLSTRQYVPYGRIPELIRSITNVSMSEGTIFNMLDRTADYLLPIYQGIKSDIEKASTVGSDESGAKVRMEKYWAWVWQTLTETYITIAPSRGFVTIENEFSNGFPQATLVSDSLSTQLKTPAFLHQLCLAHLIRELNSFIELYNDKWTVQMKALLQKAIKLKKSMSPEHYSKSNQARDNILDDFEKLIEMQIPENIPKLSAFKNRLKKHRNSVFTFLFYFHVPFDNNGSERAIRNIKVKQKVSGAFRSERGAEIFAVIRSVIDTMIKRDADVFEYLKFMINLAMQKKAFLSSP